ncbi:hypothetical protein I309_03054 [Cryptococcus deuterogattii LA55]|nr:hypothetical protein I309_03054 [Cryptococcus deuterogattii LA55]KIR90738.1 hypothetical protein I304_05387 [Cryptococcus deuterogattii CBS 10090]
MALFGSSPLMDAFPSPRFSEPPSPTKTETDLPIDVNQSFNSSLSLSDSPYFSPTPSMTLGTKSTGSSSMLSAAPPAFSLKYKRNEPAPTQVRPPLRSKSTTETTFSSGQLGRGRSFGMDITNSTLPQSNSSIRNSKGKMLPPAVPDGRMLKANASVPMQWTSSNEELGESSKESSLLSVPRTESDSAIAGSPLSSLHRNDSAMEIDSPQVRPATRPGSLMASPALSGSASLSSSPGLGSFFCESPAPPSQAPPAKRRSLVNGPPASPSSGSPSAKRTSLGLGISRPPLDKAASSSAMLFGGGRANTLASRRGPSYKRPTLGPLAAPSCDAIRTASTNSAFPILYGPPKQTLGQSGTFPRATNAPMRRAYSVCDQNAAHETDEEESEFENSPCVELMGRPDSSQFELLLPRRVKVSSVHFTRERKQALMGLEGYPGSEITK